MRPENEENQVNDASSTGNSQLQSDREGQNTGYAYGNKSYDSTRPRRPRQHFNRAEKAYGSGNSSSFRPEGYYGNSNNQSAGGYNRNGQGNFRPRYNQNGGGYRPRPSYGNQGGYNTGYNRNSDETSGYSSTGNTYSQNGGGYRPRPSYGNQGGYNNGGYNRGGQGHPQSGGYRPRPSYGNQGGYNNGGYNRNGQGGYGNSYGNRPSRPYRPRTADYDPNAKYSKKKQIEYKIENEDPDAPIRLNKYLANAGICSRREADEFIQAGVVKVNGEVVTELGTKVKRSDEVHFHDQKVSLERKVYVLLNKPKNYVTTVDDPEQRRTVMDLVKDAGKERIYPVGRLDRNTTGVLLLTNDGELASKLTHPKYLKKKVYHVTLDHNVTAHDLQQIVDGITLEDGEIHADAAEFVSDTAHNECGIEIHSGKNRIVRRMFESLGYHVTKLDRVMFAGLTKKGLRRGEWRYLTQQEVNILRMGAFE